MKQDWKGISQLSVKYIPLHVKIYFMKFFKALCSFSFHFLHLKGRNCIVFDIFILVLSLSIINLSKQMFFLHF